MKMIIAVFLILLGTVDVVSGSASDTLRGRVTFHTTGKGCPKFGDLNYKKVILKTSKGKLISECISDSLGYFSFLLPANVDTVKGLIVYLKVKPDKISIDTFKAKFRYKTQSVNVYHFNVPVEILTSRSGKYRPRNPNR